MTITSALAEDLTTQFGPRAHVATIPDGARVATGRVFAPPRRVASPLAVYAGHLYPWKGVDLFLRALVHLPAVRATIAGGHPAESDLVRLKELASSLQIDDRVTFTGFISRTAVATLLASADVLVMPHTATAVSERYASPLKLFEYMSTGKPVVASIWLPIGKCCGMATTPAWSRRATRALSDGIARVLDDIEFAARIARRAFDDATAYTWARHASGSKAYCSPHRGARDIAAAARAHPLSRLWWIAAFWRPRTGRRRCAARPGVCRVRAKLSHAVRRLPRSAPVRAVLGDDKVCGGGAACRLAAQTVSPPLLSAAIRNDMLRKMLRLTSADRVVDLGCGSGRALVWNVDCGA